MSPLALSALGTYMLQTLVTLGAIIVLAWLVVFAARRTGLAQTGGPLELIGRLPLEGRRAVYLVRVDKTVYVLGGSEAGLSKLGEVDAQVLSGLPQAQATASFRGILERALKNKKGPKVEPDAGATALKESVDES